MKRIVSILSIAFVALFLFGNCAEDSVEKDALKLAKLACEYVNLEQQYYNGDESESLLEKIDEIDRKGQELSQMLQEKYQDDPVAMERFNEIFENSIMECMPEEY